MVTSFGHEAIGNTRGPGIGAGLVAAAQGAAKNASGAAKVYAGFTGQAKPTVLRTDADSAEENGGKVRGGKIPMPSAIGATGAAGLTAAPAATGTGAPPAVTVPLPGHIKDRGTH